MTVYRISIVVAGVALATTGCSYSPTTAALLQMSPAERTEAANRVSVKPAGISTVQFKELGDSGRARVASNLIRKIWRDSCDPTNIVQTIYATSGHSRWSVKCNGTANVVDYGLVIPESPSGVALVFQCQNVPGLRRSECTILGRTSS